MESGALIKPYSNSYEIYLSFGRVLQNSNSPSSDTLESVAVVSYSEFMGVEAPRYVHPSPHTSLKIMQFRVYTQDQSGSLTEWLGNGDNNEAWTP
jgi:hypothetical protein